MSRDSHMNEAKGAKVCVDVFKTEVEERREQELHQAWLARYREKVRNSAGDFDPLEKVTES